MEDNEFFPNLWSHNIITTLEEGMKTVEEINELKIELEFITGRKIVKTEQTRAESFFGWMTKFLTDNGIYIAFINRDNKILIREMYEDKFQKGVRKLMWEKEGGLNVL